MYYGWGATSAYWLGIGVFEGDGSVSAYLHVEEDVPREPFLHANECLTTLLPMVFTQRNFLAEFLREKCTFRRITTILHFWATYAVHFRLCGKRVVEADFLSVINELILLGVTAKALWAHIDWKSAFSKERGQFCPKFQGVGPTDHSSRWKSKMIGISSGIKMWAEVSFVLSQFTRSTDRRTDRCFARGKLIRPPYIDAAR